MKWLHQRSEREREKVRWGFPDAAGRRARLICPVGVGVGGVCCARASSWMETIPLNLDLPLSILSPILEKKLPAGPSSYKAASATDIPLIYVCACVCVRVCVCV